LPRYHRCAGERHSERTKKGRSKWKKVGEKREQSQMVFRYTVASYIKSLHLTGRRRSYVAQGRRIYLYKGTRSEGKGGRRKGGTNKPFSWRPRDSFIREQAGEKFYGLDTRPFAKSGPKGKGAKKCNAPNRQVIEMKRKGRTRELRTFRLQGGR